MRWQTLNGTLNNASEVTEVRWKKLCATHSFAKVDEVGGGLALLSPSDVIIESLTLSRRGLQKLGRVQFLLSVPTVGD